MGQDKVYNDFEYGKFSCQGKFLIVIIFDNFITKQRKVKMPRYQKPPEVPQDDDYTKILEKYHEIKRQIAHAEALITDEPAEIIDICSPEKDEESDGSNEGDTLMNLRFQALASGSKKMK